MRPRRPLHVVVTPLRVFGFTDHARALRFYDRAARLPTMAGQEVSFTVIEPKTTAQVGRVYVHIQGTRPMTEADLPRIVARVQQ